MKNEKEGEKEKENGRLVIEKKEKERREVEQWNVRCIFTLRRNQSALRLIVAIATIIWTRWGTNGNAHYVSAINPLNRITRWLLCWLFPKLRPQSFDGTYEDFVYKFNSIGKTFTENDEYETFSLNISFEM